MFPYYRTCSLTTERAQDFCDQALKFDPFHIPTCLIYGQLLLETKGDLDSAERMYTRALRRNPGHLHALIGYAQLTQVKGQMEV